MILTKLINKIPFYIVLLIGLQQFPVFRLGGSFKVYELLACVYAVIRLVSVRDLKLKNFDFLVVVFFFISPTISALLSIFNFDSSVFIKYASFFPSAMQDFRYNPFVAIVVPVVYYFLCGIAFVVVSNSPYININYEKLIYRLVLLSTIIAIYALSTSILNGVFNMNSIIQVLPEYIQHVGAINYGFRASGLCQEPSFYVFYQAWIVLLAYFHRDIFKSNRIFIFVMCCNLAALVLTMSSSLLLFVMSFSLFYFSHLKFGAKLIYATILITLALFIYGLLSYFSLLDIFSYIFIDKISNFISAPDHTLDSGAYRAYTNTLGYFIFKEHPFFGVGPGASIFYMPFYDHFAGISVYGEELNPGSFPQSTYSSVIAELGLFGFLPMLYIMLLSFKKFWSSAQINYRMNTYVIGSIFTCGCLLSIAPAYSMFIWIFIALGINVSRG